MPQRRHSRAKPTASAGGRPIITLTSDFGLSDSYVASMKADLRNFALYEQNYLMDSQGTYFSGSGAAQGFVPTVGVTITATTNGGPPPSWQAIATHDKTSKTCSITTAGASIWEIGCP